MCLPCTAILAVRLALACSEIDILHTYSTGLWRPTPQCPGHNQKRCHLIQCWGSLRTAGLIAMPCQVCECSGD